VVPAVLLSFRVLTHLTLTVVIHYPFLVGQFVISAAKSHTGNGRAGDKVGVGELIIWYTKPIWRSQKWSVMRN
jgi:hypothetical protein